MKNIFKEQVLIEFKDEIFLFLKIVLAMVLMISGFLFGRIYENSNLSNFLVDGNDSYTLIEISEISDKGLKGKVEFGSLKILKNGEKISLDSGNFFLEN